MFLRFRSYIDKRDKLITLTVFHCEHTATQNSTFMVGFHLLSSKSGSATVPTKLFRKSHRIS